ncbi:MAG: IclR family transcriptional regulator [Kiritimatiellae bacterium]|jgi:DNA-binding IclR family transcriptional regulator|nr:IclR family transcriptional regulator [Kiritimatiellia bacterium]
MVKKEKTYDVPGLRAGLDIFMALCESVDGLGVAELANLTGCNKHMIFRCLKTLVAKGWVMEVGAGPKYVASLVGFQYTSMPVSRMDVVTAAREPLRTLWKELGECVYLGVMHDDMVMYLIHHEGTRNVRLGGRVGEHYWPHAAAAGKVLVAYGEPELRSRYLERGLTRLTEKTNVEESAFFADMKRVKEQGFALDDEEYMKGGICYAAPVFDYTGRAVAAIGTTVLTVHYEREQLEQDLGERVQKTARIISTTLGYTHS